MNRGALASYLQIWTRRIPRAAVASLLLALVAGVSMCGIVEPHQRSHDVQPLVTASQWYALGPAPIQNAGMWQTGGRVTTIADNRLAPTTDVWIGTASGGVWRLDGTIANAAGGGTPLSVSGKWQPVSDAQTMPIGALKLDNCTSTSCVGGTVWVGTGENGIRRDTQYGGGVLRGAIGTGKGPGSVTWTTLGASQFARASIFNLLVDPSSPTTNRRLFVTVSSGVTSNARHATVTAPPPPGGYGVYRNSTHGNGTWEKLTILDTAGSKPTDLEMDPLDPKVIWAAFRKKGVYRTTNADDATPTWIQYLADTNTDFIELSVYHPSGNLNQAVVYAVLDSGTCPPPHSSYPHTHRGGEQWACPVTLKRGSSGGTNWKLVQGNACSSFGTAGPCLDHCGCKWNKVLSQCEGTQGVSAYPPYTHALEIDTTASETLIGGGTGLCAGSVTLGSGQNPHTATWTNLQVNVNNVQNQGWADTHQILHPDPAGLVNQNLVYMVNDGGVFMSESDGATWVHANVAGLANVQVQSVAASPNIPFVLTGNQDQGKTLFTGSMIWEMVDGGDGGSTLLDWENGKLGYGVEYAFGVGMCGAMPDNACDPTWPNIKDGLADDPQVPSNFDAVIMYPGLVQDPNTVSGLAQRPLYFGTDRLYRGVKSTNPDNVTWTPISPWLTGGPTSLPVEFAEINNDNVVTAIGMAQTPPVGAEHRIFVGYYGGQMFVTDAASTSPSSWTSVGGSAKSLPTAPITGIAIDPNNANTAYVTYSGFAPFSGASDPNAHVYVTQNGGSSWTAYANGLPEGPVNTIVAERDSGGAVALWLGTDDGIFRRTSSDNAWIRKGGGTAPNNVGGLPNVAVYSIAVDSTRGRIYAGTHGRGVWALGNPVLTTQTIWSSNTLWDVSVFGLGLPANQNCTLRIQRADLTWCTPASSTDAQGNAITTDGTGKLQTAGKSLAYACYGFGCVAGVPALSCHSTQNPATKVEVTCGSVTVQDAIAPCASQPPPKTGSVVAQLPENSLPFGSGSISMRADLQVGNGASSSLCTVPVTLQSGESPAALTERMASVGNTTCGPDSTFGFIFTPPQEHDQGMPVRPGELSLSSQILQGTELIPSLTAAPGVAHSYCWSFGNLGAPLSQNMIAVRLEFDTLQTNANGGSIKITEESALGSCTVTVSTQAGWSDRQISEALFNAFSVSTDACPTAENPRDISLSLDSVVFMMARRIGVCVNDSGVGFSFSPEELPM